MGIRNRQIGWSNESNLLYDILSEFRKIRQNISNNSTTSSTTTCPINPPNPISYDNITENSVDLILDLNDGNSVDTEYAIYDSNLGLYLSFDGTSFYLNTTTPTYYTLSTLNSISPISVVDLFPDTEYNFQLIAKVACGTSPGLPTSFTTLVQSSPTLFFGTTNTSVDFFDVCLLEPETTFIYVKGENLTGTNITLTCNFNIGDPEPQLLISFDNINFFTSLSFTGYGTSVPLTKIYIKIINNGVYGNRFYDISISGGGTSIFPIEIYSNYISCVAPPLPPLAPLVDVNSLTVEFQSGDGNPANTLYALQLIGSTISTAVYLTSTGEINENPTFLTFAQWETIGFPITITGLSIDETYQMRLIARDPIYNEETPGDLLIVTTLIPAGPIIDGVFAPPGVTAILQFPPTTVGVQTPLPIFMYIKGRNLNGSDVIISSTSVFGTDPVLFFNIESSPYTSTRTISGYGTSFDVVVRVKATPSVLGADQILITIAGGGTTNTQFTATITGT
jgi:hypothetical protein